MGCAAELETGGLAELLPFAFAGENLRVDIGDNPSGDDEPPVEIALGWGWAGVSIIFIGTLRRLGFGASA